jgi:hypothetical protein
MREAETDNAVRLLDLLAEFFIDDARWTRGRYHDGDGRRCLVGALDHLRREHRIPSAAAVSFLEEAMPRRGIGLVYFNDHRCRSVAELRSVIAKARDLALGEPARQQAAAAVERWLLAALDRERAASPAAADEGQAQIPGLPAPARERIAA